MKSHIVIHHSLTADSNTVSWNAIRRYHVNEQGWKDIGYHLGIERVADATGTVHLEALVGRPFNEDGAHCSQMEMNKVGIGVVLIGNFDLAPPDDELLKFTARHVKGLCELLDIPVDKSHIHMHREFAPYKSCPGTQFPWDKFIKMLRGI